MCILLLLFAFYTTTLMSMQYSTPPQLTWTNPHIKTIDELHHPAVIELQDALLFTPQGIKFARKHLEDREASSSNIEGLDLACGPTGNHHALKLAALLHANRTDDPRGFLLQETMCNPQALKDWRAMLTQKPSLHREGWTLENDRHFAQAMLATTGLPSHLKNQFLKELVQPVTLVSDIRDTALSQDGQYVVGRTNDGKGQILQLATKEVIYTSPELYQYGKHYFSSNGSYCFFELGSCGWHPERTTRQAFNLTTKSVVEIPQDCTTQKEFPVVDFSRSGRFAILKPEAKECHHIGLYDTHTQEMLIKFPEVKHWYGTVSISPDEKWCFLPTKEGLRLYDLEKKGNERKQFPLSSCDISSSKILWSPNNACCLIPDILDQHTATYHLYYPQDNTFMTLDAAYFDPAPCFSPDGRYCYVLHRNWSGSIYDLQERKPIKSFQPVRIFDVEAPPAFFSEDPEYPYCIIPLPSKQGAGHFTAPGLTVMIFNLETKQIVHQVSNLENVFMAQWPKVGPYYYVSYSNPLPENFRSNYYPSVDIRDKKTHALVLHVNNAGLVENNHNGGYLRIHDNTEGAILVDMTTEQVIRKLNEGWQPLPDGSIIEKRHSCLYEIAPRDCDWNNIASQQLCFIMYALMRYREKAPLDFTDATNEPLRVLFESLDEYMQVYVARACHVKIDEKAL